MRPLLRTLSILLLGLLLLLGGYAVNVLLGMHAHSATSGTLAFLELRASVSIRRDGRGIPHIEASNEHDLFFAQGFVEGQDRLFQLDLLRRAVLGRLSEVFGKATLRTDERAREIDVRDIVARQWMHLSHRDRRNLRAFADGVNAAARTQPTPVEFRLALYRFGTWTPQDSLAVGMATVIDLTDTWRDIAPRDAVWRASGKSGYDRAFPLTDPCYDAPVLHGLAGIADPAHCKPTLVALLHELTNDRTSFASNEWASGAAHTTTGRALLANDPHLRLMMPGIWYLVDLRAPDFHAAGATLAGTPGVILGHNAHVAWGATDGSVASLSVFDPPSGIAPIQNWHTENFHLRFGGVVRKRYYRSPRIFDVHMKVPYRRDVLVKWSAYAHPISPLAAFDTLDRARNIAEALQALRAYPGPTQNFVLADTSGRVAYQLAGAIPDDPAWARYIHPSGDLAKHYGSVAYALMPHVAPSQDAIVWTANNDIYGAQYPLRLSPQFAPPYRAYRIAQLLRARKRYSVAYFARMQMDTRSLPELELAHMLHAVPPLRANGDNSVDAVAASPTRAAWIAQNQEPAEMLHRIASWNGDFSPNSIAATQVRAARLALEWRVNSGIMLMLKRFRVYPAQAVLFARPTTRLPWGIAGKVTVRHAFASLGIPWLNGSTFAGDGDAYTIHVQEQGFSQSFHAVWDVGNWNAGGITIPQGESGEIGSRHYTDEAAAWIAGRLLPLPFSHAAVTAATISTLTLAP